MISRGQPSKILRPVSETRLVPSVGNRRDQGSQRDKFHRQREMLPFLLCSWVQSLDFDRSSLIPFQYIFYYKNNIPFTDGEYGGYEAHG